MEADGALQAGMERGPWSSSSGRRWLIAAVALFLLLLTGWVLLALQLSSAQAGLLPFGPGLASRLTSDYGADQRGRPIAVISLSILEEAMQALGLSDDEAQAAHDSMELAMSQPVPTATALNFKGAAPFTATPTKTHTPLPTSTPTATSTNTPPPGFRPRPPSLPKTPKPTNLPATAGPTSAGDFTDPVVSRSGAVFSPPPGDLYSCTISISGIHVTDGIGSSGISPSGIGVKYDPGGGYVHVYGAVALVSGGLQPDTSWDAYYDGTFTLTGITVSGLPGRLKLARPLATYEDIDLYVFVYDIAGNFDYDPNDVDYKVWLTC